MKILAAAIAGLGLPGLIESLRWGHEALRELGIEVEG